VLALDGADYEDSLLNMNVARDGQSAVFTPDWNPAAGPAHVDPAFAIYGFALQGQQTVQVLDCSWTEGQSPSDFWVALSNFSAGYWDWFNLPAEEPLPMPELADYRDGEGRLLAIILLLDSGTLEQLSLTGAGPTAEFSANPTAGGAPLLVSFDASASGDPDGYIASFEWDFTGDLIFEYDAGTNPLAQHEYSADGDYTVYLRVNDNWGATDIASLDVQVSGEEPSWHAVTIGSTSYTCGPSLAVIDGNPAAVFGHADFDGPLSYVRANDGLGSSWGEQQDINSDGPIQVKLVSAGGRPALLYYAFTNWFSYVRADDAAGTDWGAVEQAAQPTINTNVYSMNLVNGVPAFGYITSAPAEGHYYRQAENVQGSSWELPVQAAAFSNMTDLLEVGGRPAFCLTGEMDEGLYYLRANDADGTSWSAALPVDLDCTVYYFPKMLMVNGKPAVFYADTVGFPPHDLLYVRATDATGSSWGAPTLIAKAIGFPSPAMVNGRPALTFVGDSDPYNIYYVHADDDNGDSWPTPELVIADSGFYEPSFAEVAGHPAFVYTTGVADVDVIYMIYY
jgi:PKD repeat protein